MPLVGDLEDGVAPFLPGLDAVIFSAGSGSRTGPDKTIDVDQNAAIRLIEDCEKAGVRRFLMVSAIGAAGLGARVALIEREALGGDCLNTGCVSYSS